MKILVDADASPVQTEVIEMAQRFAIQVVLVKSYAHFSIVEEEGVETVYVDQGLMRLITRSSSLVRQVMWL
ncbi:hypothetical protein JCM19039_1249 [Geomicrobium sp. JCM 19039]|nr:hypothetical protein JCM19039_1249 [Geomicrobium sp. JCM 19039]